MMAEARLTPGEQSNETIKSLAKLNGGSSSAMYLKESFIPSSTEYSHCTILLESMCHGKQDEMLQVLEKIAIRLERELIHHILDGVHISDEDAINRFMTLRRIEKAIDLSIEGRRSRCVKQIFESEAEAQKAKDNWDRLEEKVQLEGFDYVLLKDLKHCGSWPCCDYALNPSITLEEACACLQSVEIDTNYKKYGLKFLEILKSFSVKYI